MLYTSAEAAKLLRKLNEEKYSIENNEKQSSTFIAATTENIETVRPEYNYEETKAEIDELEEKIRRVKHAINKFNIEHELPGFNMTIDQVLIYIPQLTKRKSKLAGMKDRLPKERGSARMNGVIEYTYVNYTIKKAKEDFRAVSDELFRIQTALDTLNNSVKFEIDI